MAVTFNPTIFIAALQQGYLGAGVPGPIETPDGKKNPSSTMAVNVGGAINEHVGQALIQLSAEVTSLTGEVATLEEELASLKTTVAGLGQAGGAGGATP